jgi:CDGSH-type Zn-finger protein/uncharacterized Fe-S cluster protein YjdI
MAMRITIEKDGPYLVEGGVPLAVEAIAAGGVQQVYRHVADLEAAPVYALCRCGRSSTPPFCDGTHAHAGFDGTEAADRAPYSERAQLFAGPVEGLLDDGRCAYARFCHRGGQDAWTLAERAGDAAQAREAVLAAELCPSGRLTSMDLRTEELHELPWERGISVLEDGALGVSGPLFVHGGIPLTGADGFAYEVRMRYALCRCGLSQNMPFCSARHVDGHFDDGLMSV